MSSRRAAQVALFEDALHILQELGSELQSCLVSDIGGLPRFTAGLSLSTDVNCAHI